MEQTVDILIIGGGQAGLSTAYFLQQLGREFLILEQATQAANAWRNDRWDSFTLLTPNWSFRLPGAAYQGPDPEGFLPKDEIVAAFETYIERYRFPIQYQTHVTAVEPIAGPARYRVTTGSGTLLANHIVVATGLFQRPKMPAFAPGISQTVIQLHSGKYRNPAALPPGAVLVVGSGQSGCQIAEELNHSGRKVYLCTGSAGRAPRRYRGKDVYEWLNLSGFLDRTVDKLPSPQAKFMANPQVSGHNGGHSLNLHQFARDGIVLLGRLLDIRGNIAHMAPDLKENLARSDQFERDIVKMVDHTVAQNNLEAPLEDLPILRDGYDVEVITELDLQAAGIHTLIWAMGYRFDFNFVHLPIVDSDGYPDSTARGDRCARVVFCGFALAAQTKIGAAGGGRGRCRIYRQQDCLRKSLKRQSALQKVI